ncbi:YaaC family protein [Brevibacillus sp. 179-C9.3 HS]|uniref:YaaC family protein n=1 Tax=unclassified Brevibacillus TaxID=2684853 RepID=UPI0039A39637
MDNAWKTLRYLETEPTARKYLAACYHDMGVEHADRLAFQQSSRFLFLWKQARHFYTTSAVADLSIQPLLLFYGCSHLLKGMLLTRDPYYPQNSRVLQHGVTTRKLKRNAYLLMEDEIRPQKEGFFAQLAQAFQLSPLQDRYLVHDLFSSIPIVSDSYRIATDKPCNWIPLRIDQISRDDMVRITFPEKMDGPLSYSTETFIQYIRRLTPSFCNLEKLNGEMGKNIKELTLPQCALSELDQHPLFRLHNNILFFWNGSASSLPLPEWASHYLLLYLLSMLCRYETEWWGELTLSHGLVERYLVEHFLDYHTNTFPSVIKKHFQRNHPMPLPSLPSDPY